METEQKEMSSNPGTKNASWGAIISIVVILAMIVIGAMYSWNKRIDQEHPAPQTVSTSTQNQ